MAQEEWRDVPGLDGYQASSLGNIRSKDFVQEIRNRWGGVTKREIKGRMRVLLTRKNGYTYFGVTGKTVLVHIAVALAFLGDRPAGHEVDHINNIRSDNRVDNLRYLTVADNRARRVPKYGEQSHFAKITDEERKQLESLKGKMTQKRAAEIFGLSRSRVGQIWA